MTWTQLFEKDALPGDITFSMAQAADRAMSGSKLGPGARRSLRKFQKKMRDEQIVRQRENWDARDQQLRDGARTGLLLPGMARSTPASSASPRAPGAVPVPAAPRPPGPVAGTTTPGQAATRKSSFDARTASRAEIEAEFRRRGFDTRLLGENRPSTPAELRRERESGTTATAQMALLDQAHQRAAEKRSAARAEQLKAGAINARVADPAAVQARLDQLQIDPDLQRSIREAGKELPPLQRLDPFAASLEARRKAEAAAKRAKAQSDKGRPPDTRTMDDATFAAYLQLRKFAGGW